MNRLLPIASFVNHELKNFPNPGDPTHRDQLQQAGYIPVPAQGNWNYIHKWLKDNYPFRYTWTGEIFWFDDPAVASDFALRFA